MSARDIHCEAALFEARSRNIPNLTDISVNSGSGSDSDDSDDGFIFDEQNGDSSDGSTTLWIVVSVVAVLLIMGIGAFYVIRKRRIAGKAVYFDEKDVEVEDMNDAGKTTTGISIQEEDVGEEDIVVGMSFRPNPAVKIWWTDWWGAYGVASGGYGLDLTYIYCVRSGPFHPRL